ncbi:MAG TPA: helix-turn-helix domain-containing protein [Roseovarius sp.]
MTSPARLKAHPVTTVPQSTPRARLPFCLSADANLFREGDACSGLFEVVSGVFRLSRLTRGGRRYVVGFGFPGDILGYGSDHYHISDCEAVSDAQVIRHLPKHLSDNSTHQALLKRVLRQVEAMQEHCMILGRNSARDRVAAFVSMLGDRLGVRQGKYVEFGLPMPRTDIADYLGLTTETVSRSLTELRNAKLIAIENVHHVILLQPQHLNAMAEGEA